MASLSLRMAITVAALLAVTALMAAAQYIYTIMN